MFFFYQAHIVHYHFINVILQIILSAKYPQIKKLFGYDPNFKWVVTAMVMIQFLSMFIIKDLSYPMVFLVAYCFGGIINHSLMLGESVNAYRVNEAQ